MRRYLNEFLSDRRVIDYSPWIWQPLLQLVILTKRPFSSGANYKSIWNEEQGRKPADDDHQGADREDPRSDGGRYGDDVVVDFCMRYGNPSTEVEGARDGRGRAARRSSSSRSTRNTPAPRRPPRTTSSSAR
jgi:protoporphyrin/coproporphyrin ferrochelatase